MDNNSEIKATAALRTIKNIVADLPDTVPLVAFESTRWNELKSTTTKIKVSLGGGQSITFYVDLKDPAESA